MAAHGWLTLYLMLTDLIPYNLMLTDLIPYNLILLLTDLSETLLRVFVTLFPPISGLSLNKFLHPLLQHLFHSTHWLFYAVSSSPASKHTSSLFHTPLNSPPSSPIHGFQPVSSAPLVPEWAPENTPTLLVLRGYKAFIYLLTWPYNLILLLTDLDLTAWYFCWLTLKSQPDTFVDWPWPYNLILLLTDLEVTTWYFCWLALTL